MRRGLIVLLVPLATLTYGMLAQSAGAEVTLSAEWLLNGAAVTSTTAGTFSGEAVLEDAKAGLGVKCSLTFDVTFRLFKKVTVEVLLLVGSIAALTSPLLCKSNKFCEESATDIEAAPENLPWNSQLEQTEAGAFREITSSATYSVSCLVLGIKVSEECTAANSSYELKNVAGGVEIVGKATPNGTCTVGGANAGEVTFVSGNLITPNGGGTLSVSE